MSRDKKSNQKPDHKSDQGPKVKIGKAAKNSGKSQSTSAKENPLQAKLKELTEALQRERADALNAKKRLEEEKANLSLSAKSSVLKELLPVLDASEAALKLSESEGDASSSALVKKLQQIMQSLGVEKIEAIGAEFDPELHNAVMVEEGENDKEIIIEELQSGYTLNGKVLRHSMVKVSK